MHSTSDRTYLAQNDNTSTDAADPRQLKQPRKTDWSPAISKCTEANTKDDPPYREETSGMQSTLDSNKEPLLNRVRQDQPGCIQTRNSAESPYREDALRMRSTCGCSNKITTYLSDLTGPRQTPRVTPHIRKIYQVCKALQTGHLMNRLTLHPQTHQLSDKFATKQASQLDPRVPMQTPRANSHCGRRPQLCKVRSIITVNKTSHHKRVINNCVPTLMEKANTK